MNVEVDKSKAVTKTAKERKEEKQVSAGRELISFAMYLAVVLVVTFLTIHYVGQRTQVNGDSMMNTLSNGDNLIVDKISYRFNDPKRFDIIVFPFKYEENTFYIKRVIGLPGEVVQIDDAGNIYINGEKLEESYGREVIKDPGLAADPVVLGEDEYFVMGDNRNDSMDSRVPSVGVIDREDIIGRAWLRIFPLDEFGFVTP